MKTAIYTDTMTGDLVSLISDDLNEVPEPILQAKRNRDLRHALARIAQAKRRKQTEAIFRHQPATMAAVHAALRKLGYLPRKYDTQISVVSWGVPQ